MHFKLLFCIVLLQLLLIATAKEGDEKGNGDAKSGEKPEPDVKSGEKEVDDDGSEEEKKEKSGKVLLSGRRISRGRLGAAERAVAVDLTRGWCRYLPVSTREACWTEYPRSTCRRCDMQGVMRLAMPPWACVLSVHLVFERPCKYSFNLGDSATNNAWGGDGIWSSKCDAEVHNFYSKLYLWRNQYACNSLLDCHPNGVRTALLIRIYQYGVYITNYEGLNVWRCSNRFFKMYGRDYVYMGFNRVIKSASGLPCPIDYTGTGLCFMAAYWTP